ncbi:MAG: hypothetical protein ACLFPL_05345 [Candidatus Nanoarchaeia archaeon]
MTKKVLLKAIVDIAGKPAQVVSDAIDRVEQELQEHPKLEVRDITKADPDLENEKTGMYTAFIEVELECRTVRDAMVFIVDYLPASVEILEPHKLNVTNEELTDVLNDMVRFQIKNVNEIHQLKVRNHALVKKLKSIENKK